MGDGSREKGSFRASVIAFVSQAEAQGLPSNAFTITQLVDDFSLQRRRIYDVLNVFEAIGCTKKSSSDTFTWLGLNNIRPTMDLLQESSGAASADMPMVRIIPTEVSISMGQLTISFLLCFLSLHVTVLDIKEVGYFISRDNNRFKRTLCKLYQIIQILETIGIVKRGEKCGEISIEDRFFHIVPIHFHTPDDLCAFSLASLLNRPVQDSERILRQRRLDFGVNARQNQVKLLMQDPVFAKSPLRKRFDG
jgi:hypothetical protein